MSAPKKYRLPIIMIAALTVCGIILIIQQSGKSSYNLMKLERHVAFLERDAYKFQEIRNQREKLLALLEEKREMMEKARRRIPEKKAIEEFSGQIKALAGKLELELVGDKVEVLDWPAEKDFDLHEVNISMALNGTEANLKEFNRLKNCSIERLAVWTKEEFSGTNNDLLTLTGKIYFIPKGEKRRKSDNPRPSVERPWLYPYSKDFDRLSAKISDLEKKLADYDEELEKYEEAKELGTDLDVILRIMEKLLQDSKDSWPKCE